MKLQILTGALMLSLLTVVDFAVAQDTGSSTTSTTKMDEAVAEESADYRRVPISINPQIGLTSLSYTGRAASGSARSEVSGGVTAEFGEPSRRLETGALILRNNTQADDQTIRSGFLALPMLAKIRVMKYKSQSWFVKAGAMTMLELNSSNDRATNNLDVMGSLGVGGRFAFTQKADLVLDATYNRGMLNAIRSNQIGSTYNQGFLVMAGLSFNL